MAMRVDDTPAMIAPTAERGFLRQALVFVVIGVALYAALVAVAERRVRATGERNPFFQIATMPPGQADVAVLGASHAMPLGFDGVDAALEQASGRAVATLAIEGGGILPNAVVLDALLRRAPPRTVVYAVDSFAFLSPQWNEDRLTDSALYRHAPYDSAILSALAAEPAARPALLRWLTGFDKVNGMLWPTPDRSEAELTKFDRTYRPNDQIDSQRVAYLFPDAPDTVLTANLGRFETLAVAAQDAGAEFIVLLMPAPPRYASRLPQVHERVMDGVRDIAAGHAIRVVDHTGLLQGDENYYDTDHLNRTGATAYATGPLAQVLRDG